MKKLSEKELMVELDGQELSMSIVAHYMDDDIREKIARKYACVNPYPKKDYQKFVNEYFKLHRKEFDEEFTIN